MVQDFSDTGSLIRVYEPGPSGFKLYTVYYLSITLFQTEIENLYCTVRNQQAQNDRLMLGVEFGRTTRYENDTLEILRVFLYSKSMPASP